MFELLETSHLIISYIFSSSAFVFGNLTDFFHKRHVRKYGGPVIGQCAYTCFKCLDETGVKIDSKKGKGKSLKGAKAFNVNGVVHPKKVGSRTGKYKQLGKGQSANNINVVPLRRSARRAKLISQQIAKTGGTKRGRQTTFRKVKPKTSKKTKKSSKLKKQKREICQKKRTLVYHSYWWNGLWLSRKPNHERQVRFVSEYLHQASEQLNPVLDMPACSLCHKPDSTTALNYISCEICGGKLKF